MAELEKTVYILIDMSYFIFYRYYALINWWKHAKPDNPLDITKAFENKEFMDKFEKTILEKLKEIPKRLKLNKGSKKNGKNKNEIVMLAAKDCHRKEIWRNEYFDKYKEQRELDDYFMVGPFFEKAYELLNSESIPILFHPKLEGDDCIAIMTEHLKPNYNIYIVANDMDYLQLSSENVTIINLKYKLITDSKKWSGEAKKDLFCKIVMGDKSDNIPSIFKKCGPKTAIKCYEDEEYFNTKLKKENGYENFNKNKKLIDFNEIPIELRTEFMDGVRGVALP